MIFLLLRKIWKQCKISNLAACAKLAWFSDVRGRSRPLRFPSLPQAALTITIPLSMFLILCQVNNSHQGQGKSKYVHQILKHLRCLWRRNTEYSRRDLQNWGLLDYLLYSSQLSFFASLFLLLTIHWERKVIKCFLSTPYCAEDFGFVFKEKHMLERKQNLSIFLD